MKINYSEGPQINFKIIFCKYEFQPKIGPYCAPVRVRMKFGNFHFNRIRMKTFRKRIENTLFFSLLFRFMIPHCYVVEVRFLFCFFFSYCKFWSLSNILCVVARELCEWNGSLYGGGSEFLRISIDIQSNIYISGRKKNL